MRILMINLGYAPDVIGGAETVVHTLAHALAGRGARVSIAALSSRGQDWQYEDAGVRVYFLAAHPMGNLLMNSRRTLPQRVLWQLMAEWRGWSRDRISKLVKAEQPDLVHTHNLVGLSTSAWAIARAHDIPAVHSLHGYQLLCPAGTMLRRSHPCAHQCRGCRVVTMIRRRASAYPSAAVGNSAFTLQVHLSAGYFPRATHHVIHNAPPPQIACHARELGAFHSVAEPQSSGQPPLRIGYLGRLAPYKGAGLLLEALVQLPQEGWVAKVAGRGAPSYVRGLKDGAERFRLPVSFVGWVNAEPFLRAIDLLVVPSIIAEPQGMGIVEAVSRRVPVVYADVGGLGEIGTMTPGAVPFVAGSADDLARVLRRFVSAPPELHALRRCTFAPNPLCDVSYFAERYIAVYQQTLHRAGAPSALAPTASQREDVGLVGESGVAIADGG